VIDTTRFGYILFSRWKGEERSVYLALTVKGKITKIFNVVTSVKLPYPFLQGETAEGFFERWVSKSHQNTVHPVHYGPGLPARSEMLTQRHYYRVPEDGITLPVGMVQADPNYEPRGLRWKIEGMASFDRPLRNVFVECALQATSNHVACEILTELRRLEGKKSSSVLREVVGATEMAAS